MLNDAFNKIEPIVYGFYNESKSLNSDIVRRGANERIEVIGRAYIAREMTIEVLGEIENKLRFFEELLKFDEQCGVSYYETNTKFRFLHR